MDSSTDNLVLESLQNDLSQVGDTLKQLAQLVIAEKVSEYPVFVAAHQFVQLGKPVFDLDDVQLNWYFNISTLEEMTQKGVVKAENLNRFRRTYGDPEERACIFVVTETDQRIVFVPYVSAS